MRRAESEEYRQQLLQDAAVLDIWVLRQSAAAECTRTIQTGFYEPRERPSKTGQLRRG